ncbi:hypothetical protein BWZ22_05855 [Seonamhaeicola sp. S2-3]|uniref:T9SS type A sorting domain-containing protein n=1 Tax=Seonamhaeicola sp. S2-3 TaxID=1936081 RepID=UPI00097283B0|nr:T9SS type A sorting domain-containing protein [Seonamhaeicola sp. S2-3]APY10792.1 hypothetical protein BWZ22_05855 [Seonamhaeicola sp. S2-3]
MKRIILTAILLAITLGIRAQSNATQIEYFLDVDNGFGQNTVLDIASPDIDIAETVLADIPSGISAGYHKLYIRVKDVNGNWSQTIRKHIEIVAPFVENNIVMGEYYIDDTDTGYGNSTTFPINPEEQDIEQAFTAQIAANVSLGYHKLFGRIKDSYGNWSHTFRKNIQVYLNPDTDIVEIEYFFEDDFGFSTKSIESISTPSADGAWTFNVSYPTGNYNFNDNLFVRVKDSNNKWSITTILDEIESLSIDTYLQEKTLIYPNPFSDNLFIKLPDNQTILKTKIYNNLGQVVYTSSKNNSNIKLDSIPNGLYVLVLESESGKAAFKIIKN